MMLVPMLMAFAQMAGPDPAAPPGLAEEIADLVLNGQDLPAEYRARLMAMSPADRMIALVLLRRSGLLRGQAWNIAELLAGPISGPVK